MRKGASTQYLAVLRPTTVLFITTKSTIMKTNMGSADRAIRMLLAVVLSLLYVLGEEKGGWWLLLPIIACIMALTSIAGFCPLYKAFGINTKTGHKKPA
jgi:hypothetical protein